MIFYLDYKVFSILRCFLFDKEYFLGDQKGLNSIDYLVLNNIGLEWVKYMKDQ